MNFSTDNFYNRLCATAPVIGEFQLYTVNQSLSKKIFALFDYVKILFNSNWSNEKKRQVCHLLKNELTLRKKDQIGFTKKEIETIEKLIKTLQLHSSNKELRDVWINIDLYQRSKLWKQGTQSNLDLKKHFSTQIPVDTISSEGNKCLRKSQQVTDQSKPKNDIDELTSEEESSFHIFQKQEEGDDKLVSTLNSEEANAGNRETVISEQTPPFVEEAKTVRRKVKTVKSEEIGWSKVLIAAIFGLGFFMGGGIALYGRSGGDCSQVVTNQISSQNGYGEVPFVPTVHNVKILKTSNDGVEIKLNHETIKVDWVCDCPANHIGASHFEPVNTNKDVAQGIRTDLEDNPNEVEDSKRNDNIGASHFEPVKTNKDVAQGIRTDLEDNPNKVEDSKRDDIIASPNILHVSTPNKEFDYQQIGPNNDFISKRPILPEHRKLATTEGTVDRIEMPWVAHRFGVWASIKFNYLYLEKTEIVEYLSKIYKKRNITCGNEPIIYSNTMEREFIEFLAKQKLIQPDEDVQPNFLERAIGPNTLDYIYDSKKTINDRVKNEYITQLKEIIGALNYGLQKNLDTFSDESFGRVATIADVRGIHYNGYMTKELYHDVVWEYLVSKEIVIPSLVKNVNLSSREKWEWEADKCEHKRDLWIQI